MTTLLLGCSLNSEITRVAVLDGEFRKVNTLSSQDDINKFKFFWDSKSTLTDEKIIDWSGSYKLDISTNDGGNRWMYHPEGWVSVGSMKKQLYIQSTTQYNLINWSTACNVY